jgi:hypothetical protein
VISASAGAAARSGAATMACRTNRTRSTEPRPSLSLAPRLR